MWHKPCRTFHPWCLCIKTRCLFIYVCAPIRDQWVQATDLTEGLDGCCRPWHLCRWCPKHHFCGKCPQLNHCGRCPHTLSQRPIWPHRTENGNISGPYASVSPDTPATILSVYIPSNSHLTSRDLTYLTRNIWGQMLIIGNFNGHGYLYITMVASDCIPKATTIPKKSNPWFDQESREAPKARWALDKRVWQSRKLRGEIISAFRRSQAKAQRHFNQKKGQSWAEYVSKLSAVSIP